MELSVRQFRNQAISGLMLLVSTTIMLTGCVHLGGKDIRPIWKERDQFVEIEKQDRLAGSMPEANSHPTQVSAERLSSMLASIEVRMPGKNRTQVLFNPAGIKTLSENISQGLASAAPNEDVTFAYIGIYPVTALMSIVKEDQVTTGRVFVRDGQLNIIFGKLHDKVNEREERRLNPYLPGSRDTVMPQEMLLVARPGGESFTFKRPDWVVFPLVAPAVLVTPTEEPAVEAPAPSVAAPIAPGVSHQRPAPPAKKSVEERLTILKGLKEKGLITEEEFKAKRQEILNDL
jgi:hypothetical protein